MCKIANNNDPVSFEEKKLGRSAAAGLPYLRPPEQGYLPGGNDRFCRDGYRQELKYSDLPRTGNDPGKTQKVLLLMICGMGFCIRGGQR
jgi:hypothetical protein